MDARYSVVLHISFKQAVENCVENHPKTGGKRSENIGKAKIEPYSK